MEKKNYKWLSRLVDKITKEDCPNNCFFKFYRHVVILQSGMPDFVAVSIDNGTIEFSFDFLTKELNLFEYENDAQALIIYNSFKKIYKRVYIESDCPYMDKWYND